MKYDFVEAFSDIDDKLVTDVFPEAQTAVELRPERRSRRFGWKKLAAAAACLAAVAVVFAVVFNIRGRQSGFVPVSPVADGYPKDAKYKYEGDFTELELGAYGIVDRVVYHDFDSLAQAADLIVVGTFVDDARQDVSLTAAPRPFSLPDGHSYNKLRIDTVYKGDAEVGSEIVISDSYYVHDGYLCYTYGVTSTPMIKGEQWVYFLHKVSPEYGDYYYSLGGYDGRFTVPGNENTFVLCDRHNEFDVMMNVNVYPDVKKLVEGDPSMLARIGIEYEGIKYNVVGYKDIDGVKLTVGTTKSTYEAGEYVRVLGIVENTTDAPIGLAMNVGHGAHQEISTDLRNGADRLKDLDIGLYEMGSSRYVIKPGEVYYQPMRFGTYINNYKAEDTVIAEYVPLGRYTCSSGICLVTDPEPEFSHDYTPYVLDYSIEIVNSRTDHEFTMDEFPGVKFSSDKTGLLVNGKNVFAADLPIKIENLYLIDINSDGKRELCATAAVGSGIVDTRVMAYDCANGKLYELADRGYYDYRIDAHASDLSGDEYYVYIRKYDHSKDRYMGSEEFNIGLLFEIDSPSTETGQIYKAVKGVTEVELGSEMSMDDFPGEKFVFGEKSIDATLRDGSDDNIFGMYSVTPIEHIYLADLNDDGRREFIIEYFGQTYETDVPYKAINIIDHKNGNDHWQIYTYEDLTLTVKGERLYAVVGGEVQSEPLTIESFKELDRSLGI